MALHNMKPLTRWVYLAYWALIGANTGTAGNYFTDHKFLQFALFYLLAVLMYIAATLLWEQSESPAAPGEPR